MEPNFLPARKRRTRPMTFGQAIWRGWRLRCPVCGVGKLYRTPFAMHERCRGCGLKYNRAPGYFLGSIYVNYGVTTLLMTAGYLSLWATDVFSPQTLLWGATAFVVVFSCLFFYWARSLWIAFDQFWDPSAWEENDEA
jgi:uncharacterized protein (DUF983 family)